MIVDFIKFIMLMMILSPLLFVIDWHYIYLLIIIIFFIIANNLFTYCFSFIINEEEDGQKMLTLFNLIYLMGSSVITLITNNNYIMNTNFEVTFSHLTPCSALYIETFRFIQYISLIVLGIENTVINRILFNNFVIYGLQCFLYLVILIMLEKKIFFKAFLKVFPQKTLKNRLSNEYIENERSKVTEHSSNCTVKIYNLTKVYRKFCTSCKAIDQVKLNNLAIPRT